MPPWDKYSAGQPAVTPLPPKAPTGFQSVGPGVVAPLTGGPEDPQFAARKAAAEAGARAAASTPIEVGGQITAARAKAAIELANEAAKNKLAPKLTAEERAKALATFKSSQRMGSLIEKLRQRYQEGPGATSGLYGLGDYLPTVPNSRFNTAANSMRGDIGTLLGFTGGQLNTATEANMAVGPYIAKSSDYDPVIEDKIGNLELLTNSARDRAIAQLGGTPDDLGNIRPMVAGAGAPPTGGGSPPVPPSLNGQGQPPLPGGPSSPQNLQLSQGQFSYEPDPARAGVAARVNDMLRSGVPDDQIRAYVAQVVQDPTTVNAALAFRRKNPNYRGDYDASNLELKRIPLSATRQMINNAAQSGPGTAMINAADAVTFGTLDNMTSNPALARAGMEGARLRNPGWATAGQIGGGVLGAGMAELGLAKIGAKAGVPLVANLLRSPRTADALYGAATGAGNADDGSRLTGALLGAGAGVGGGMAGRATARGAGQLARGVRNMDVQALSKGGVPLTVGQAMGGVVKGVEDRLSGIPIVGDVINNRRREGLAAYNASAFDQGLQPIASSANGQVGEQGVDAARSARNAAYRKALNPVSVKIDPQLTQTLDDARSAISLLPKDMAEKGLYALNRAVENVDDNGVMSGKAFQQAVRRLRKTASENAKLPNGDDLREALAIAEGGLRDVLERQAPGAAAKFARANTANRNVEVLRGAVNRARNGTRSGEAGIFTPSQLADEAAANAKKFGGTQGTTQQPFFNWSRAGQRVLPNTVPDSGTAGRLATLALPAILGGTGASAGYAGGDTGAGAGYGLGIGALLALGGSKAGQKAMTSALLKRPDSFIRIGDKIYDRANLIGALGVGGGLALTGK